MRSYPNVYSGGVPLLHFQWRGEYSCPLWIEKALPARPKSFLFPPLVPVKALHWSDLPPTDLFSSHPRRGRVNSREHLLSIQMPSCRPGQISPLWAMWKSSCRDRCPRSVARSRRSEQPFLDPLPPVCSSPSFLIFDISAVQLGEASVRVAARGARSCSLTRGMLCRCGQGENVQSLRMRPGIRGGRCGCGEARRVEPRRFAIRGRRSGLNSRVLAAPAVSRPTHTDRNAARWPCKPSANRPRSS